MKVRIWLIRKLAGRMSIAYRINFENVGGEIKPGCMVHSCSFVKAQPEENDAPWRGLIPDYKLKITGGQ